MGYFRGLMHGAAVGTVVGLCIAPQTGDKTRAQIRLMTAAVVTPDRGADEDVQVARRRIAHPAQWSPTRARLRPGPACESTSPHGFELRVLR